MQRSDFADGDERERDDWLTRQLGRLKAAYPSFRPDVQAVAEWRRVLYELRRKRGKAAVAIGIGNIIDTVPRFVPSLAEVHLFLPPLAHGTCENCRTTNGWVYLPAEAGRLPRVTRCTHAKAAAG